MPKRLREETGLSQLALAKRARVSQAYISETKLVRGGIRALRP